MRCHPSSFLQFIQNDCKNFKQLRQIQSLLLTKGLLHPYLSPLSSSTCRRSSTLLYNALIRAHFLLQKPLTSLIVFSQMLAHAIEPDSHTFPSIIKAASSSSPITGKIIHAQAIRRGLATDLFVNSCIVRFYARLGALHHARQAFAEVPHLDIVCCNSMLDALFRNGDAGAAVGLFQRIPERDVVSWTSVINGFFLNGHFRDSIMWFRELLSSQEAQPNEATLVSVLSSCTKWDGEGALHLGKQIHGYVIKNPVGITAFVGTALIDMYGKNGCLGSVYDVFDEMSYREVCTWNALISSLACNGNESEAIAMFQKMTAVGLKPDSVTFVGLLTACARAGYVEAGLLWFNSMWRDYGLAATMEHYGCVVDLLGRVGLLKDAWEFIQKMHIDADASVLGALLGACKVHGDVGLGDDAGKKLLALDPNSCGRYVVLSNLHAQAGRWDYATELRDAMARAGVKKIAGYSKLNLDVYEWH